MKTPTAEDVQVLCEVLNTVAALDGDKDEIVKVAVRCGNVLDLWFKQFETDKDES